MANDNGIVWMPSESRQASSQMASFKDYVNEAEGINLKTYWDLHRWSIDESEAFWQHLSNFSRVTWQSPYKRALTPAPDGNMLGVKWFDGGMLNFAENLLSGMTSNTKLISVAEGTEDRICSKADLIEKVRICAAHLREQGVGIGDRVAGVLPNSDIAIVGMLATASIGAIWSSCSPDFGVQGIVDRFAQIEPKVLFVTASYKYGGKLVNCVANVEASLEQLPTVKSVLIDPGPEGSVLQKASKAWLSFDDLMAQDYKDELIFEPMPFDAPLYIMFSSGTTGVPKCIVHSIGGTLIQHKKELSLHSNLREGSTLLYFTTCGWMMWNWMASALSVGSNLVLFDGSPAYPEVSRLWEVLAKYRVDTFGTSPKFLAATEKSSFVPHDKLDLSSLTCLLSTGAPLLPEQFDWILSAVGDVHIASISGGTDIISCFMLGCPLLPVYRGEIQVPGLGMAVECWVDGKSTTGQKGELVCTKPFPSMPVGFWNDPDQVKYRDAYFEFYPDQEVWRHGDYIAVSDHGGITVFGRSDATLNPGGVRIGTAEIYRVVENLPFVEDSIAVGRQCDGDVEIILFVKAKLDQLGEEEIQNIRQLVRSKLTPRHVPRHVFAVREIPYTRSGKKLEIAVTRVIHGEDVPNQGAIANPSSLLEYKQIANSL
ncbi:acetoacetate--CoA ligase [Pseudobacteriovorax antillogorgiicola]|uniref:Acetoacetyl-CoA synthetase n=2 Tax=Pseudobacteriovorax antillogorgiicola TaxID=1513793 RepID=A0A1Y6BP84_9BACT|nr:acetoacetate--CoA ligase [Pseudobacteriovorax antillogorgiicola]TCS53858.1 acetoacetyl-CoA synthetase [Pseudobacteriovorax antillogorgiicola]SMF21458.1 acetoacetyl-CoA synthetase [Pseudobacteriovorax antillogorgiicola]